MTEHDYAIPVAKCPLCRHSLLYARESGVRTRVSVFVPPEGYRGYTVLCAKCKRMIGIRELPPPADRNNSESEPSSRL